jgi:uncharacterized membrane protein
MITRAFLVFFVQLFAMAVLHDARAQNDEGISIPMKVCNHTSKDALIASQYLAVNRSSNRWWTGEGWFRIEAGTCGIVGTSGGAIFYLRGESTDGSVFWAETGETHCALYPGPYTITVDGRSAYCPDGAKAVDFSKLEAKYNSTFTWNLY